MIPISFSLKKEKKDSLYSNLSFFFFFEVILWISVSSGAQLERANKLKVTLFECWYLLSVIVLSST